MTESWNAAFIGNTKGLPKFEMVLEIGCFVGNTSKYICDHMLNASGKLICVDPLADQYLVEDLTEEAKKMNDDFTFFNGQYNKFIENTKGLPLELYRMTFNQSFGVFWERGIRFDFIYVDGDHREESVYNDAVGSFEVLNDGGYILFDDYLWKTTGIKSGIDRFLKNYNSKIKIILINYQVLIQRIK